MTHPPRASEHRPSPRGLRPRLPGTAMQARRAVRKHHMAAQKGKDGRVTGCGCISIDKCEYANPADRAGRRGPGPRCWLGRGRLRKSRIPPGPYGAMTPRRKKVKKVVSP